MKTYKNLFNKLVDIYNIKVAIHNASLGKRDRKNVQYYLKDVDKSVSFFIRNVEHYKNRKHKPKTIYDGVSRKQRTILVPTFDEQVVHHMIVNILKPIFMKSMYEYSCGSIPGRGTHSAKNKLKIWILHDYKDTKYCLKMDIQKFFDSIPHDILKEKLSSIIKDDKFLAILFEIIDVQPVGLPLGFYTSQWLANFYLTKLDHYIKEQLLAKYYIRYMDDMVILGGNKKKLSKMRVAINSYLINELGLKMKKNWQIFKIEYRDKEWKFRGRPLDFMGFRFNRYNVTLRRSIMLRASRKARRLGKAKRLTVYSCRQMLSYVGWLSATNTYGFYTRWIKPYVNIKQLKTKISNYDRRKNKCGTEQNTA